MKSSLIQPYFVMSAPKYYKSTVADLGISHFYSFTCNTNVNSGMIAVPDGCTDILFTCDPNNQTAEVCGSVLQAENVLSGPTTQYFGVRFYPGQGYAYKDVKLDEIINNQIPLGEVLDASELIENINTSSNFNEQIKLFMNHYSNALSQSNPDITKRTMKNYMLSRIISAKGNIRVRELADEMGYSERYVNMKFIEYFGMRPKVFCKIIRFQSVLNQLNRQKDTLVKTSLIDIAMDAGYYDQSHMTKDFSLLSKNTPSKYLHLLKETDYDKRLIVVE